MLKLTALFFLVSIALVNANEKCNIVNCFVNPCQVTKCNAYPQATCSANYCGGCFADFYLGGNKVNCNAPVQAKRGLLDILSGFGGNLLCTNTCFVQPCAYASCPAHPYATCRDNYCNGCTAEFYVNNVRVQC